MQIYVPNGYRDDIKKKSAENLLQLLTENGYTLNTPYVSNKEKVNVTHISCNTSFNVKPNIFQQGSRCPKCAIVKRKNVLSIHSPKLTIEYWKNLIESFPDYKLLDTEYVNNKVPFNVLHEKCNKVYSVRPNDFQQGYRCPICSLENSMSKAVLEIKNLLIERQIAFDMEVTFKECRHKRPLRFDFCIYLKNKRYLLVEYDGSQHTQLHNSSSWVNTRPCNMESELLLKDKIKNEFCAKYKINLYRINFNENHIDRINEILKFHSL
jgi:predicted Zn-ribbon and HTH transcriptional regulator